jgi:formylglycine-generating enzyme required for sulfatase activity
LKPPPPYRPFGALLDRLQEQGLRIGADTHIRVQQLLNAYAHYEELQSISTLRFQMGALVATSEAELRLFYSIFDDYVAEFAGEWFQGEIGSEGGEGRYDATPTPKLNPLWYLLSLLPLLVLGWLYLRPLPCPEFAFGPQEAFSRGEYQGQRQTIRFVPFGRYQYPVWTLQEVPAPDSVIWWFGDGDSSHRAEPVHHYQKPGLFRIRYQVFFPGCSPLEHETTIEVRPIVRQLPNFSYTETENGYRFIDQSQWYDGDSVYRPWDTLQAARYEWDFGSLGQQTGKEVILSPRPTDTLEVRLRIRGQWRDTSTVDSIRKTIYPFEPPELPSLRTQVLDVSLADLLKKEAPRPWLFWLMLSVVLGYLILEGIQAWQRKVVLDEAPLRGPPFRQALDLEPPPLDLFHTRDFYELARRLRRRRSGAQRKKPDVPKSIRRSAEAGGFPELAWQIRSQPSQYLVLVEQKSPHDHLARLFAELARELESRDISVEVYFFRGEPRFCWRRSRRERISLGRLRNLYPDYRLLVIGEGEALLEAEGGEKMDAWTEVFTGWQERAWLSTRPTEDWGLTENALAQGFVLVPATQQGFASLIEQWQAEEPMPPRAWQKQAYEMAVPEAEEPAHLTELRAYLGEPALHWLAACAWYPELSWSLSLRLGKRIEPLQDADEPLGLDLNDLIRIFRLPWFRKGQMPRSLREALVAELPEEQAQAVRELLLQLLKEPRNRPPEDSYAAADQQVRLALFAYLNSEQDREARQALQEEIKDLDPDEVEDQLSLRELGKVQSPLSLIVPARYFRGQAPIFGLQQKWRLLVLGLPLLAGLVLSAWSGFSGQEKEAYDPNRSYAASELELNGPLDSARWYTHEGYLLAQDPRQDEALADDFQDYRAFLAKAFLLSPDFDTAVHNYSLSGYYDAGRDLYQQGDYPAAADTFTKAYLWIMRKDSNRRLAVPQLWLPLGRGLSKLVAGEAFLGLSGLRDAFCLSMPDTAYQMRIRDSLMRENGFTRLLNLRVAENEAVFGELVSCIDSSLTPKPPVVYLHATLTDPRTESPVQGASVLIPGGPNLQSDANGRVFYRYPSPPPNPNRATLQVNAEGFQRKGYVFSLSTDSTRVETVELTPTEGNLRVNLSDTVGCAPLTVTMTAQADVPIGERYWYVTNYPARPETSPTYTLTLEQPQTYSVWLVVRYTDGSTDTLTDIPDIEVLDPPIADIQYRADAGDPLLISFGAAEQTGERYAWDFGDGAQGNGFLVEHRYEKAGTYAVQLIQANDCAADTARAEIEVQAKTETAYLAPEMVRIPAGRFAMGDVMEDNEYESELPVHQVQLRAFELAATEVSFAEYDLFCAATERDQPEDAGWGRNDRPVIYVDWYDALEYCNWLSEQMGYAPVYTIDKGKPDPNNRSSVDNKKWLVRANWQANGFRLPTEAEWEYAARQAGDTVRFGNGRDTARVSEINFNGSESYKKPYSEAGTYRQQTLPVHSLRANELGLYHMSGNVYEWCWDWYGSDYYAKSPSTNPYGPQSGEYRVRRGGSWGNYPVYVRASYRSYGLPDGRDYNLGFRLARTP